MTTRIFFNDTDVSEKYKKLKESSNSKDVLILKEINKAIDKLAKDPFLGIQIPKRQIPKDYTRIFKPDNLWKYDLDRSWRLIYWISSDDEGRITILIDWMNHKQYDKLFGYSTS
ncbi:Txe/YoeB family toxin of Txe-Axe toxin-antitoxin module [Methanomicrobium sp. W14]|uniref:hypothetical protein n=1 Tax=Methanomicrobium sp. W14 TaxID=2817839 RepID=UPI001AE14A0C|nr:hypothetical protein [Methanomicrobium sp. W14]MBP2132601.1 Txe/YoeB family toxin of Txe-Axe toxin-antitoxin module [Methanomicrobium sp. W14]